MASKDQPVDELRKEIFRIIDEIRMMVYVDGIGNNRLDEADEYADKLYAYFQAECNRARLTQTKRILNSLEDERREYGHLEGAIDIVENKLHIAELELQQLMKGRE